jgi:hypothetical protein
MEIRQESERAEASSKALELPDVVEGVNDER